MFGLLGLDWEATGVQRPGGANPFNPENRGVCLSLVRGDEYTETFPVEYDESKPYLPSIPQIQSVIDSAQVIVMMNAKYDYNWCLRYGIQLRHKKIWDIQVFHFIQNRQTTPYPSLNSIAEFWGLPLKKDIVKTEYWDNGLDTEDVPWDILSEYCDWDTLLTVKIAKLQMSYFKQKMSKQMQALVRTAMYDIHNLVEMEYSGFIYDNTLSKKLQEEAETRISELTREIRSALGIDEFPEEVQDVVNLSSNDHLSALLYGGVIKYVHEEAFLFEYKDPKKQPVLKTRKVRRDWPIERRITPLPKSALAKDGYYSTNEDTLRKVKLTKANKHIVDMLLELSKLEKLVGTYFAGFPKLLEKMGWGNVIHSTFNQCRAATGRLSSDKPNLQNITKVHKVCFISRFEGEFDVSLPKTT